MNSKDLISTICGIVIAVCGAIVGAIQAGVVLPTWVNTVCLVLIAVAGGLIGVVTGKNPNLTAKTPRQVDDLNNAQAATKDIK